MWLLVIQAVSMDVFDWSGQCCFEYMMCVKELFQSVVLQSVVECDDCTTVLAGK